MAEILRCPNPKCGALMKKHRAASVGAYWLVCVDKCGYESPAAASLSDAVRIHNLIASRVPTDKLKQLEAKWRYEHSVRNMVPGLASDLGGCADELSALIKGESNG